MNTLDWDLVVERWLAAGDNYRRDTEYALRGLPCAYCGDPAQTLDHITPRVAGGSDNRGNLVPACRSCNGSKSGRSLFEWAKVLRAEVRRAAKRRRQLTAVERMLVGRDLAPSGEIGLSDDELDQALERAIAVLDGEAA